jgi:hypothetical protein
MLGILGLAIVLIAGVRWFQLMKQVAIPRNRVPFLGVFAVGGGLGLVAIAQGGGWVGSIAGGVAALLGFAFFALRAQSAQKPNRPAVEIGGPILAFSAPDENGVDFDLSNLKGKPYLLKFFRGHW